GRRRRPFAGGTRQGGANTPLSEHALANALDVSEFVFASGEHITVLESWPRLVTTRPPPPANPRRVAVASAPVKPVSQVRPAAAHVSQVAKIRPSEATLN